MATTNTPEIVISGLTLSGREAICQTRMVAEATHYLVIADGIPPTTGSSYASKLALNSDAAEDLVVVDITDIAQDANFIFHITRIGTLTNLPYSGALTQVLTVDVTCVGQSCVPFLFLFLLLIITN